MDKKITSIAGVIFALAFVTIFIAVWGTSQNIIGNEAEQVNDLYRAEVPFDINLFDNKVVTGQSLINLESDLESSKNSYTAIIGFYSSADSTNTMTTNEAGITATGEYLTSIHRNTNQAIDGLVVEEVRG